MSEGTFALGSLTAFAFWLLVVLPLVYRRSCGQMDSKEIADWLVAVGTLALAGVTFILAFFAYRQGRDTRTLIAMSQESAKAAGDSASAALIQARMAVSSRRAHMVPGFRFVVSTEADWDIEIVVENKGSVAGTVGDTFLVFRDTLPSVPDYSTAIQQRDSTVLSPGRARSSEPSGHQIG